MKDESCGDVAGHEEELDAENGGSDGDAAMARDVEERGGVVEAGGRFGRAEVERVGPGARVAEAEKPALVERRAAEVLPVAAGRARRRRRRGIEGSEGIGIGIGGKGMKRSTYGRGRFNGRGFNGGRFNGRGFNGGRFNGRGFNGGRFNGRGFNGRGFNGGRFNGGRVH